MFANPNEMACSLVILIPIAVALSRRLRFLRRLLVWVMIATFIVSIYLSYSRGSLIGLFVVFAYMGWRQKSQMARFGMIAALAYWSLIGVMDVNHPRNWQRPPNRRCAG